MFTVPSSSMLISQPDFSTNALMFLPPGPINAPIFSGLIFMRKMRGAKGESSGRDLSMALSIWRRIASASARLMRPLASARRENSPGSAILAPSSRQMSITSRSRTGEP